MIYDTYSNVFINKIIKTKFNIIVENYDEFIKIKNKPVSYYKVYNEPIIKLIATKNKEYYNIENIIIIILCHNIIINNEIYGTIFKDVDIKKLNDFGSFTIDIGMSNSNLVTLYKINSKYYDQFTYVRKYIPYLIRWNNDNDYYILNREYEYIGLDTKYINYEQKGYLYTFNDSNPPWNSKNNFLNMYIEYRRIIKDNSLKKCLNPNSLTEKIISSYE